MNDFKHKGSADDFGKQFKYHSKIDDYWGSLEMLKDIVNPFDLNYILLYIEIILLPLTKISL